MSSSMLHATDAQHPQFASTWAAMNSLTYESDGVHEFRSPNGLDLDTSSEEDSPTNYSGRPHASSRDIYVQQYRVPVHTEQSRHTGLPYPASVNHANPRPNPAEDDAMALRADGQPLNFAPRNGFGDEPADDGNVSQEEANYRVRVQLAYNRGDMNELEKVLVETHNIPEFSHIRRVTKKAIKKLFAQRVLEEPLAFGTALGDNQNVSLYASQTAGPAVLKASTQDSGIGIARKNDNTFVMDLLPGVVGWVIGRAGTRIKEIQGQSGCKMWVDQDVPDDQPRKLYFHGSKANIEAAIQLVNDLLHSAPILAGKHGQVSRLTSHIMDCPPDLVGLLIGKKGWTIKKIQQESGAQISINQSVREGLPRKIIISGTDDAVKAAIALIEEVLKNKQDMPARFVGEDQVRAISLPPNLAAAGLSNPRSVTSARMVPNGSRPMYAPEPIPNGMYPPSQDMPVHPNTAPPGFAVGMNGQMYPTQRGQARSVSPQLMGPNQRGGYMPQQMMSSQSHPNLVNFNENGMPQMHQQQLNGHTYAQHAHAWHQHSMMQAQHQQQQQHQSQQPQPQQQAVYQQPLHQVSGYAQAAAMVPQASPAAGAQQQSATVLEQSMNGLSLSSDAAVDSLLNVASVMAQSGAASSPASQPQTEEWHPMPPASASPLWQPSSMIPGEQPATSASLTSNNAPSAAAYAQFDMPPTAAAPLSAPSTLELSLENLNKSPELSANPAAMFGSTGTKPDDANVGTTSNTQKSGWEGSVGQMF